MMTPYRRLPLLAALTLAGCGSASHQAEAERSTATARSTGAVVATAAAAVPVATARPERPRACSAEIGAAAAAKRVKLCSNISPATRPPCNAGNSCAMIEDEIARSCALLDGKGPAVAGCAPAPTSMQAAADVVRRYYSALNARDYSTAWLQWGEDGQPGQTLASFERGFARTRATRVTIGKLSPGDGAAGSIYQTFPVTVEATLTGGTRQRFAGAYVIRRVNGVDGASPAQLR